MPKARTQRNALTRGQLARRWGVSVARVRQLIDSGRLGSVFEIPAVDGFGKVLKIPIESVKAAERDWSVGGVEDRTETEQDAGGDRCEPGDDVPLPRQAGPTRRSGS